MQFVSTRVGRVAVSVEGSGPPMVLLHSVAHDHHDFDDVVPALSRRFRTIAVDWPGHGESEPFAPPESASSESLCDALEDVVEALGLSSAIFMGNSVGGTASIRLAARKPERVRGLVLVDTGGLLEASAFLSAASWVQGREWVRRLTGLAFARHYLKARTPAVARVLERIEAARARPDFVPMDAAIWRSFGRPEANHSDDAALVRCPTLLVWGKRDPVLRASVEGARARRLLPHAGYVELDTGHAPFIEAPGNFLQAIEPFLGRFEQGDAHAMLGA